MVDDCEDGLMLGVREGVKLHQRNSHPFHPYLFLSLASQSFDASSLHAEVEGCIACGSIHGSNRIHVL